MPVTRSRLVEDPSLGYPMDVAGVKFVVEQDQSACPVGVAFPGAVLAEVRLRDLTDEVEGVGRDRSGQTLNGHGVTPEPEEGNFDGECTSAQNGQEKTGKAALILLDWRGMGGWNGRCSSALERPNPSQRARLRARSTS